MVSADAIKQNWTAYEYINISNSFLDSTATKDAILLDQKRIVYT